MEQRVWLMESRNKKN